MSREVAGPYAILVVPESSFEYDRGGDWLPAVRRCVAEDAGAPPAVTPGLPFAALATQETVTRHGQLNCSFWALGPDDARTVVRRLRDLADFIERESR
jgi:hypothetical protein